MARLKSIVNFKDATSFLKTVCLEVQIPHKIEIKFDCLFFMLKPSDTLEEGVEILPLVELWMNNAAPISLHFRDPLWNALFGPRWTNRQTWG